MVISVLSIGDRDEMSFIITNGHFSRKKCCHNTRKSYNISIKHRYFGIDTAEFINSLADEQKTFIRVGEKEMVKELLTYFICRVKERMSAGPKMEE